VIVSCDLSGQEIRLLAEMSGDKNMLSAYLSDPPRDLHSFTAAMIQGVSYEEFRARLESPDEAVAAAAAEARQIGKIVFFASSYGAGAAKIAETLGVDEAQGEAYLAALDRAFPRVAAWKRETEVFAAKQGWVPILGGGRRHLAPLLSSRDAWEAQKALRQASNARIQGAGGNQLRRIMGRIWDSRLLDDYDFQFYWPVHDEVVFSVGREDAVEVIFKLHSFMCERFLERIPSASSIGIGRDFGNLIEIGERADPDLISGTLETLFKEPTA
jgi:DNA polymerase-1